jgi:hypothetical protein
LFLVCEHQLALLRARPEDRHIPLACDRPERSGHRAGFGARRAATRAEKRQREFGISPDAHVARDTAQQGARIGDAQPARARGGIVVGIGFELMAENRRGVVFDAQRRAAAGGGLDIGGGRAAAEC